MSVKIENKVDGTGMGFAVMFSLIGIGAIIMTLSTFIYGCITPLTGVVGKTGTLQLSLTNGVIWGLLYGGIILFPLIYKLIGSIMDYRSRTQPDDSTGFIFISLGNILVFAFYITTVYCIAGFTAASTGYVMNPTGLSIALAVIAVLLLASMVVIHIIDGINMKHIIADNTLFKEKEVNLNE